MNSLSLPGRRIAVFDAEIKKPIEECSKGWQSHDEMGISCLCLFDYSTMRYRVFDDHNAQEAIDLLWNSDLCVGFNTVGFDWKLIRATYPSLIETGQPEPATTRFKGFGRRSADFDILREIWIARGLNPDKFDPKTHGGYKLDDVAYDTIAMKKSGNGALAPQLYQQGRLADVIDYCLEDVRIEKTLFEFVLDNGYVVRNGYALQLDRPTI